MSATNGTAYPPVLKLGDLTPDQRPVEIMRMGTPVTLSAFVDGPRCPGYVKARVAKARQAYAALAYVPDETGAPVFRDDEVAWDEYLREVLLAVIEGLTYPEAEVLAGNQTLAVETLRALGWVRQSSEDAPPEADGGGATTSTTGASSPASAGSTRARRGSRS